MKMPYRTAFVGVGLLVLVGLYASRSESSAQVASFMVVWALLGMSWNLISGYAGPISLGQGAFFGVTSFTTTLLMRDYDLTPYVGILVGIVLSVALAAFVGYLTLRLSGLYFALATLTVPLTLGVLVRYFGYYEIARPYLGNSIAYFQFNESLPYYVIGALLVTLVMFFTAWLEDTRLGRYFVAIRENERAAEASGVPTFRYKMYAFLMAAVVAALAGGIYSQLAFVLSPDDVFNPLVSVQALLVVLVGGAGTVLGPVLGALVVIPGGEFMARRFDQLPGLDRAAYAVLLLAVAFWSPRGLYPYVVKVLERVWPRRRRVAAEVEERGNAVLDDGDQVGAAAAANATVPTGSPVDEGVRR